jgi:hypothetical protein
MLKNEKQHLSDKNKGGWLERKYNYMSMTLSCLQFKKFYPEIALITDKAGYELLINRLELPYTHVEVVLDELDGYDANLWALGKIYAYSIQKEPFIHADGDIYIWEKLNPSFKSSPLIAQNMEKGFTYYDDTFKAMGEEFEYIPEELGKSKMKNGQIIAVNAGLIGGNSLDFFKDYTEKAFDFVNRNHAYIKKINTAMFNIIFEQFLFHAMAEEKNVNIEYLTTEFNDAFDGMAELTGVPGKVKYVHPVRPYKQLNYIGELIGYHLQKDYPEHYYRIINLLRTHQI